MVIRERLRKAASRFRKPMLYPTELRVQTLIYQSQMSIICFDLLLFDTIMTPDRLLHGNDSRLKGPGAG